ncbi:MAG: hypothetical protein HQ517_07765 [SAR324 cluster bacterium]|nr:hypothetical protein [SAR324 cluster bacterium]
MNLNQLKKHIKTLANLPEIDELVVSCYLALENGHLKDNNAFEEYLLPIKRVLSEKTWQNMEDAVEPIRTYLSEKLLLDAKGIAIFSRAGDKPFFLPLQFRIPLPNWIVVDSTPNIYHLVELKDKFHRYVVLITTQESTRILEINVGSVTRELWTQRPELRERVGREWTKMHYQKHTRERGRRFIKEEVKILQRLMAVSDHTHLVIAGHPLMTAEMKQKLPKQLLSKLVDLVPISDDAETSDVVRATIGRFVMAKEEESQYTAELLLKEIHTGGLAVAGVRACLKTLNENRVDILVMLKTYSSSKVCVCVDCEFSGFDKQIPSRCPNCGGCDLREFDTKEEMVRLAEVNEAEVEIVSQNEALNRLGGVGCLLRYRLPEEFS